MLNALLHRGLGATSRNMITYSSWMQKFANDPFKSMVTVDKLTTPIVVISDGASTWNVDLDSEHTVSQALEKFFRRYPHYDLLPTQNKDGSYTQAATQISRNNTTKITDEKAAYQYALQNKTLRTLSEVLASNNPSAKLFYIPYGYYYIGNSVAVSPYANYDAAAAAKDNGDKFISENRGDNNNNNANTQLKQEKDNTILYLLIALLGVVAYKKFLAKNNSKKKK